MLNDPLQYWIPCYVFSSVSQLGLLHAFEVHTHIFTLGPFEFYHNLSSCLDMNDHMFQITYIIIELYMPVFRALKNIRDDKL
jgi:hypothetical protein